MKDLRRQIDEIEALCKPIQEYLKKNFHPYASVTITSEDARVEEVIIRCKIS